MGTIGIHCSPFHLHSKADSCRSRQDCHIEAAGRARVGARAVRTAIHMRPSMALMSCTGLAQGRAMTNSRRSFLQLAAPTIAFFASERQAGEPPRRRVADPAVPSPESSTSRAAVTPKVDGKLPMRELGATGAKVSILGLGGAHVGRFRSAAEAMRIVDVGFTGHKNPSIHLATIARGFRFDTVQMPLNPFDATFRSFASQVVPVARKANMASSG